MSQVHVAVAVVKNERGKILIALRPEHLHQGGLWEFPGGKVETGETAEQALVRELNEEIGIRAQRFRPFMQIEHDYADKRVMLDVWVVEAFAGEVRGAENQQIAWVRPADLVKYQYPAANQAIVDRLTGSRGCDG